MCCRWTFIISPADCESRSDTASTILGALGDDSGICRGAATDVESHVVESFCNPLKNCVSGNMRQLLMKPAVKDPKADRIARDGGVGINHRLQFTDILGPSVRCSLAGDLDFDQCPAFECFIQSRS